MRAALVSNKVLTNSIENFLLHEKKSVTSELSQQEFYKA